LAVLVELCDLSDEVRLGQLMALLGFLGEDQTGRTLWDLDDEQLLAVMYHHRRELTERTPDPRNSAVDLTGGVGSSVLPLDSTNPAAH
jgi:hypothetical protein